MEKEKSWELERRIRVELELNEVREVEKKEKYNVLREQEKNVLRDNNELWGKLIYFWKYTLEKTWKKIVFVYIFWMILYGVYELIKRAIT